jgi:hypothetical protein
MLTAVPSTCRYASPYWPLCQCPAKSRALIAAPLTVGSVVADGPALLAGVPLGGVEATGAALAAAPAPAEVPHPAAAAIRASAAVVASSVRGCTSSVSFGER